MARPAKYTPQAVERIVRALLQGATYQLAASYGGIHYDTFNEWRKRYPEFSDAVKSAEAGAAVGWLEQIEQAAASGTWQAAAWKLERRYPEDWGRRERVDLNIRRQAEQLAAELGLDPEELLREAERIVSGRS